MSEIINKDVVMNVAKLANLRLDNKEIVYYEQQLKKVLGYVNKIAGINPEIIKTSLNATPEREDVSFESFDPQLIMQSAPKSSGTSFQVPRILE